MYGTRNVVLSNGYQQYLSETRLRVNSELSKLASRISTLRLSHQIQYALLSRGKRLRPILLIASSQCVGGDGEEVMPLALSFELVHTAALIHDDIIDEDEVRRGRLALFRKWSVKDAILVGDAMIALAINLAADFGGEILRVVSQHALELCDGEYMDLHSSLGTTTQEEYFSKTKGKSASLFRAAAYCGALLGGGSRFEIEALSRYGENLGIAYQLRDDILDLESSAASIPMDLKAMRITLPLIHLYETSGLKVREQLGKDLQSLSGVEHGSVQVAARSIQTMLREAGSLAYCKRKNIEYVEESIQSIKPVRDCVFKSYLIELARSLII